MKQITMTYIEVQEKRLKRKKDELQTIEDVLTAITPPRTQLKHAILS